MFSFNSFIVYGLTFVYLTYFEFISVYFVRKCSKLVVLYVSSPVFPASFIEEVTFALLYILVSFVKYKVPISVWVISDVSNLFHWSIFLSLYQYYAALITVALQYNLKSGRLIPPAPVFFLKVVLALQGLLCFLMNCNIFCQFCEKICLL